MAAHAYIDILIMRVILIEEVNIVKERKKEREKQHLVIN